MDTPPRYAESRHNYYLANQERLIIKQRAYYQANKERIKIYNKEYREKHKNNI
jgi:hypothetical protein